MSLTITFQKADGPNLTVIAYLTGSLNTTTAPELERQLAPILAGPATTLVFDLAKLTFVTSAGIRQFEIARKALRQRNGQVTFVNLQPQIKEVFAIIAALPGYTVFKDQAEMDAYLTELQRRHTQGS